MPTRPVLDTTTPRPASLEISAEEFKKVGHKLIDALADFYEAIPRGPVTPAETPQQLQVLLGQQGLPQRGTEVAALLDRATELVCRHSLLNGHPKFFGYITAAPAPIGALADLLAAAINPNVGANVLSPMATAIEKQTVKWLAEFIGVSPSYGGLLVSGGNMANLTAFLAARTAKAPQNFKEAGLGSAPGEMVFYCSTATHTWIEKAAVLLGHGTNAIRWIPTKADNKLNINLLEAAIEQDRKAGKNPFLVIGNAGDVSTGVVDDLAQLAAVCQANQLWFHIDGAYGIPAAVVPEYKALFDGLQQADSIALDPHKWLYAPLEAGCTLVKDPQHLLNTYSAHPAYYNFDSAGAEPALNFYEYGVQNSRGFRALKVWLALQQVGKNGYVDLIRKDIQLAQLLYEEAANHPELEAVSHNLSITTLRYVPLRVAQNQEDEEAYINELNEALVNRLQQGGEVFLSNAVIGHKYCLRACIVNFRTSRTDILEVVALIVREGRRLCKKRGAP